jgi:signal transduction histidine kinase/DNA-binding response OmpR family regulator
VKLSTKLLLVLSLLVGGYSVSLVLGYFSDQEIIERSEYLQSVAYPASRQAHELINAFEQLNTHYKDAVVLGDEANLALASVLAADTVSDLNQLSALGGVTPAVAEMADQAVADLSELSLLLNDAYVELIRAGDMPNVALQERVGLLAKRREKLANTLQAIAEDLETRFNNELTRMQELSRRQLQTNIIVFLLALLVTIPLASLAIRRVVLDPLNRMLDAAREDRTLDVSSLPNDEVGELARAFSTLHEQQRVAHSKLTEHKNTLEQRVALRTAELSKVNVELEAASKRATEMARSADAASAAKSEFLASMSHEIRTPMNGVLGMIELLRGTRLDEQQRRYAGLVRDSGEMLLRIINDILDFSKIEAGKLSLECTNFNLRDLIEDLGDMFSFSAQSKGLELACKVPGNIPESLMGDAGRLRQVFTNLVGNAVKFTESGEILINVSLLDESDTAARLRFEITDTGIGIKPEVTGRIFESFSQADGSTTRRFGGTGLGLAISRQLVDMMGGKILVDSVYGEGSTFWFELDLDKQQNIDQVVINAPQIEFGSLHVLVVDDNATNREILDQHLEHWGISHVSCGSGAQALDLLHGALGTGKPFNMMILDYHMPEMDGLELARRVNNDNLLSGTRMVMFSSQDDVDLQKVRQNFNIDCALMKPVRQSDLYECLVNKCKQTDVNTDIEASKVLHLQDMQFADPHILLVEDNVVNQAVATGLLRKLGCTRVTTANNGQEALEACDRAHYDLILMDMQMPIMDGYEAMSILRKREQAHLANTDEAAIPRVPIVALTANAMEEDRQRCLEAGADDYLSKPVSQVDLQGILVKWLPQTARQKNAATMPQLRAEDAPSVAVSASPIDQSALDVIRGLEDEDAPDILSDIVGIYLDQSPQLLDTVAAAIVNQDAEALRVAAHTLKSSSANLGAIALAQSLSELEEMGRAGHMGNAQNRLSQLTKEYRLVHSALAMELKGKAV